MKNIEIIYLGTSETDKTYRPWEDEGFIASYKPIISYLLDTALVRDIVHTVPGGPEMAEKIRIMLVNESMKRDKTRNHMPFDITPCIHVIETLRGPSGCSWDKAQTYRTLRRYLLEEVYEMLDAVDQGDMDGIYEELGDILYHVVLYAQIASEEGYFTPQMVVSHVTQKMITRHPYVFSIKRLENTAADMVNWDRLKQRERRQQHIRLLDGVVNGMPSLLTAYKLQEKSAQVGFEWKSIASVWDKVKEELQEFCEAIQEGDPVHAEEEAGDVLFIFANVCRRYHIEPECALHRTNRKFYRRFAHVEERVQQAGKTWQDFSLEELESFWQEAKILERKNEGK